jgi:hypothetical protein
MPSGKHVSIKTTPASLSQGVAKNVTRNQLMAGGVVVGTILAFGGIHKLSTNVSSATRDVNMKASTLSGTTTVTEESTLSNQGVDTIAFKSAPALNATTIPIEKRLEQNYIKPAHTPFAIKKKEKRRLQKEAQNKIAELTTENEAKIAELITENKKQQEAQKTTARLEASAKQEHELVQKLTEELEAAKNTTLELESQVEKLKTEKKGDEKITELESQLEKLKTELKTAEKAEKRAENQVESGATTSTSLVVQANDQDMLQRMEKNAKRLHAKAINTLNELYSASIPKEYLKFSKESKQNEWRYVYSMLGKVGSIYEQLVKSFKPNDIKTSLVLSDLETNAINTRSDTGDKTEKYVDQLYNNIISRASDLFIGSVPQDFYAVCDNIKNENHIYNRIECISKMVDVLLDTVTTEWRDCSSSRGRINEIGTIDHSNAQLRLK